MTKLIISLAGFFLISISLISGGIAGEFPYECSQSSADINQQISAGYQRIREGDKKYAYLDWEWFDNHCWNKETEVNSNLRQLLETIMLDSAVFESLGENASRAYEKYLNSDSLIDFILKHQKQVNGKLRDIMLEKAAMKYPRFDDLVDFCMKNNIIINARTIFLYASDLKALKYLFDHKELFNEAVDIRPYSYVRYGSVSNYILHVLGAHLETLFPEAYLEKMSSKDLRLLRNGIYATYGKNFKSKILQYYFYGEYPYVKEYCRNGQCGMGSRHKGQYNDSDLTDVDRQNLDVISKMEQARITAGHKEPDLLIENYDLDAFIEGKADNFVLTSSELREIYQVKVDWNSKKVWIWDKRGVSGWDLKSQKRFKLYSGAKGPIGLASNKHLLAYQLNSSIYIDNYATNETIFQHELSTYHKEHPLGALNIFSDDGNYFVFSTGAPFNRETYIFGTETREARKIDLGQPYYFYWGADESSLPIHPVAFTKNNRYLIAFIVTYDRKAIGLSVVPLEIPGPSHFLNYKFRKPGPSAIYSITLDDNDQNLYLDMGFGVPIQRFSLNAILASKDECPPMNLEINPGKADFRYVYFLRAISNFIIRGDHYQLGIIDLKKKEQTETDIIATGTSFDIVTPNNIYAAGQKSGFVLFKRF